MAITFDISALADTYAFPGSPAPARPAPTPAAAPPTDGTRLDIAWRTPPGMLALSLVNFALRVVTLGLYNFWGKTETRARLWSGLRIAGEPLAYLGTGRELCFGFIAAFLYLAVPYLVLVVVQVTAGMKSAIAGLMGFAFFVVLNWLWSLAVYRARRYRLTRTSWRGIRGDMVGEPSEYAWTSLWTSFVLGLTVGLAHPWRQTKLQRMLVENTRLGGQPLTFTATTKGLKTSFAAWIILGGLMYFAAIAITLALTTSNFKAPASTVQPASLLSVAAGYAAFWLAGSWFGAHSFNHYVGHTHLGTAKFRASASGLGLVALRIGNALLAAAPAAVVLAIGLTIAAASGVTVTDLGALARAVDTWWMRTLLVLAAVATTLLTPFIAARSARFWVASLALDGPVDLASLRNAEGDAVRSGEGLAQAFDIDVF